MAKWTNVSDEAAVRHFHSLEILYTASLERSGLCASIGAADLCRAGGSMSMLQRHPTEHYFRDLLPCRPGVECVRRQSTFTSCAQLRPGEDNWLEVTHLSGKDGEHLAGVRPTWPDFFDGRSELWFVHTPGSGVFYHAGRSFAASSKNAVLAGLLREWLSVASSALRSRNHAVASELRALSARHGNESGLLAALEQTTTGVPCAAVRLGNCFRTWVLNAPWDLPMMRLGRALGYDTLFMTASLRGPAVAPATGRPAPAEEWALPELVDLRVSLHVATPADALAGVLRRAGTLSLRNPLAPGQEGRPCVFSDGGAPTLRLGCQGHASWALRWMRQPFWGRCCLRLGSSML